MLQLCYNLQKSFKIFINFSQSAEKTEIKDLQFFILKYFYEKDYSKGKKEIVLTDNFFKLCEGNQFSNLSLESEARWSLVETAWNLKLNPNMIVSFDESNKLLYINDFSMKRVDITTARNALNGYQKGKCFYSFIDLNINEKLNCDVDHVLPHLNKFAHYHSKYPT